MDLKELRRTIPYQWRVQSFSKQKPTATCVAYIDARDVMELLDEVVKPENWQSDYKSVDGQMFGGIGILIDGWWVWKWDTGSESNVEKEKGQASDSFKRAAVKWGIGRFLYDLEVKTVKSSEPKKDNNTYPYVVDDNGQRVWNLTKHLNGGAKSTAAAASTSASLNSTPAQKASITPPKSVVVEQKKAEVKRLCDEKALVALLDKKDYAKYVLANTGLVLEEGNLDVIIERLKAI